MIVLTSAPVFDALSVASARIALRPSATGALQEAEYGAAGSLPIRFHEPVEQSVLVSEHS